MGTGNSLGGLTDDLPCSVFWLRCAPWATAIKSPVSFREYAGSSDS